MYSDLPAAEGASLNTSSQVREEIDAAAELLSESPVHVDSAVVLDFGSQTAQLIVRRVREANVYAELLPHDVDYETVKKLNPMGIILSGGPTPSTSRARRNCPTG